MIWNLKETNIFFPPAWVCRHLSYFQESTGLLLGWATLQITPILTLTPCCIIQVHLWKKLFHHCLYPHNFGLERGGPRLTFKLYVDIQAMIFKKRNKINAISLLPTEYARQKRANRSLIDWLPNVCPWIHKLSLICNKNDKKRNKALNFS